jgi:enterochelin esterase-like enzyme
MGWAAGRYKRSTVAIAAGLGAFLAVGLLGVYRYADNYWLYRGFAPPQDPAFVSARGTAARFSVVSPALGGRRQPVDVYLPPGYSTSGARRYPVLYLLHGFPGRQGAFLSTLRLGVLVDVRAGRHLAQPPILVMPSGSTGTFTDKEWADGVRPHEGWATFVARDVVHAVDTRYRTIRRGSTRALAGLSEGGYGALNIGLTDPGEFGVLESWSGYVQADDLKSIFGGRPALLRRNSPIDVLPSVAARLRRAHVYVWLYSGSTDRFRIQNRRFAALLAQERVPYHYYEVRGGHNWALWRAQSNRALLAAATRLH